MAPTPSFVQLFGPVQAQGAFTGPPLGPSWNFVGTALSASTKNFYFNLGLQTALQVMFKVIWMTPNVNTYIRLVKMDDGPTNIQQLLQIQGTGSGQPSAQGTDMTGIYNTLVAAQAHKHLGFQIWDDGVNPAHLYEVRLEIV